MHKAQDSGNKEHTMRPTTRKQGRTSAKTGKFSKAYIIEWANEQRHLFRAGRLEQRKVDKLNAAGFDWDGNGL